MKLEDKIRDRRVVYFFRGNVSIATELALLYYLLGKRKKCRKKIAEACGHAIEWLQKAQVAIPEYLRQLSCYGQLEEIEKLLVKAKANI
ncbi:hypothetical protein A3H38_04585 [candidate division WOR-1 bacterium RIFCSPLOWO2_02_FULL_46_20]|uniref:Uncharacterized protein n=2 Tax=Saganbacteria TaxID=1703751 RepID=A0A1F4R4A2_UNCSA|nr:MAG: hypothetical protein A3J44_03530 [candidate division WOR-1 bacterium RIFCSPHIGHO2_02_FULL_45_12]OGC02999.1 MAG: hypothetical protein A3H38_04585 [candidate division WOR-1 bacterium RIFCSPLOWO2_02_FULL_46_20]OGC10045.1 MAG: hypothetical protein A3F86_02325 [candidate division WOR-1 bacterium RIFCSPLOWO2_12_FULL_45_9]